MSCPNLLVVCVDCLREDLLASDRTDTPALDAVRADGIDYRNCFSTTTTTTPAVASLLTGSYSERNGLESLRRGALDEDVDTLATVLARKGYHTTAMVTGPLVTDTGLDRGFDDYRYREPEDSVFGDWLETAREELASLPEPFGAYVHLWELHEDITVPAAFDDPQYGELPYERALSALDRSLEALFEAVPDDTVVAVTGDHGESISYRSSVLRLGLKSLRDGVRYYGGVDTRSLAGRLNRAMVDRAPDVADHFLENGHGENVYDFTTNVPLLLSGPGIDPATVDAQCRQVDVLPTLYTALGIEYDGEIDGESLLPPESVADRPAYMRACGASLHRECNWARAIRHDGAKLVTYPDRDWDDEVYDLEADPLELEPVDDADLAAELRRHLPAESLGSDERMDIDERLRSLGYR